MTDIPKCACGQEWLFQCARCGVPICNKCREYVVYSGGGGMYCKVCSPVVKAEIKLAKKPVEKTNG